MQSAQKSKRAKQSTAPADAAASAGLSDRAREKLAKLENALEIARLASEAELDRNDAASDFYKIDRESAFNALETWVEKYLGNSGMTSYLDSNDDVLRRLSDLAWYESRLKAVESFADGVKQMNGNPNLWKYMEAYGEFLMLPPVERLKTSTSLEFGIWLLDVQRRTMTEEARAQAEREERTGDGTASEELGSYQRFFDAVKTMAEEVNDDDGAGSGLREGEKTAKNAETEEERERIAFKEHEFAFEREPAATIHGNAFSIFLLKEQREQEMPPPRRGGGSAASINYAVAFKLKLAAKGLHTFVTWGLDASDPRQRSIVERAKYSVSHRAPSKGEMQPDEAARREKSVGDLLAEIATADNLSIGSDDAVQLFCLCLETLVSKDLYDADPLAPFWRDENSQLYDPDAVDPEAVQIDSDLYRGAQMVLTKLCSDAGWFSRVIEPRIDSVVIRQRFPCLTKRLAGVISDHFGVGDMNRARRIRDETVLEHLKAKIRKRNKDDAKEAARMRREQQRLTGKEAERQAYIDKSETVLKPESEVAWLANREYEKIRKRYGYSPPIDHDASMDASVNRARSIVAFRMLVHALRVPDLADDGSKPSEGNREAPNAHTMANVARRFPTFESLHANWHDTHDVARAILGAIRAMIDPVERIGKSNRGGSALEVVPPAIKRGMDGIDALGTQKEVREVVPELYRTVPDAIRALGTEKKNLGVAKRKVEEFELELRTGNSNVKAASKKEREQAIEKERKRLLGNVKMAESNIRMSAKSLAEQMARIQTLMRRGRSAAAAGYITEHLDDAKELNKKNKGGGGDDDGDDLGPNSAAAEEFLRSVDNDRSAVEMAVKVARLHAAYVQACGYYRIVSLCLLFASTFGTESSENLRLFGVLPEPPGDVLREHAAALDPANISERTRPRNDIKRAEKKMQLMLEKQASTIYTVCGMQFDAEATRNVKLEVREDALFYNDRLVIMLNNRPACRAPVVAYGFDAVFFGIDGHELDVGADGYLRYRDPRFASEPVVVLDEKGYRVPGRGPKVSIRAKFADGDGDAAAASRLVGGGRRSGQKRKAPDAPAGHGECDVFFDDVNVDDFQYYGWGVDIETVDGDALVESVGGIEGLAKVRYEALSYRLLVDAEDTLQSKVVASFRNSIAFDTGNFRRNLYRSITAMINKGAESVFGLGPQRNDWGHKLDLLAAEDEALAWYEMRELHKKGLPFMRE
jgi:hypothetical protein